MKKLKSLVVSGNYNLRNLQGIENLNSLESLILSDNENLLSLAEIESLPNLKSLKILISDEAQFDSIKNYRIGFPSFTEFDIYQSFLDTLTLKTSNLKFRIK